MTVHSIVRAVVGALALASIALGEIRARPPLALPDDVSPKVFVGEFLDGCVTDLIYRARFRVLDMPVGSPSQEVISVSTYREASRADWRPPKVAIVVVDAFDSVFGRNAPRSIIPYEPATLTEIVRRAHSREELANFLRTDAELPPEQAFALAVKEVRRLPYAWVYLPPQMARPVLLPRGDQFEVVLDPRQQASPAGVWRKEFGWAVGLFSLPDHPPASALTVLVLDSGEIGQLFSL